MKRLQLALARAALIWSLFSSANAQVNLAPNRQTTQPSRRIDLNEVWEGISGTPGRPGEQRVCDSECQLNRVHIRRAFDRSGMIRDSCRLAAWMRLRHSRFSTFSGHRLAAFSLCRSHRSCEYEAIIGVANKTSDKSGTPSWKADLISLTKA
jgi:hypothetical protein